MSPTRTRRTPVRRALALSGVAAVTVGVMVGCSTAKEAAGGEGQGFLGGDGRINVYEAGHRKDAPELSGTTLQGKPLDVADYRGKVVVLNIWGSWCSPCRAEAKHLKKVSEETAGKGVQFVGINIRDEHPANARSFERNYRIRYPSLHDPAGKLVARFQGTVPAKSIPTTLILDREGKIAVRALTAVNTDELREALEPLVAEKT